MQRRTQALAVLVAAAMVALGAGCANRQTIVSGSPPYTVGSDRTARSVRTVDAFHEIEANGAVRVAVAIGATPSVEVTTDDNLVPMVTTTVADGRLTIGIDGSISTHLGVDVTVVAPSLDTIIANASAVIRGRDVVAPELLLASTSAADVSVSGAVDRLELHVLSGARASLYDLAAKEADVEVSGAARAEVQVTEAVHGAVLAGGTLWIDGDPPVVEVTTSAAGEVKRR